MGFVVAGIRMGVRIVREGLPDDLGAHIPEIFTYLAVYVVAGGYVFAVGRGIAEGLTGSFLGGLGFALLGIFAGTRIGYDATGVPYPLLIGASLGLLAGAPLGAAVQRSLTPPRRPDSP